MPRKPTILANEENSQNSTTEIPASKEKSFNVKVTEESESEDDASKTIQLPKPKRQQTEKQKEATAKMRQKLAEKHAMVREQKAKEAEETKKIVEEKVVKKAIAIKKKQIKQQKVLDEISDDDTPIEEIIPIKKKSVPAHKNPVVRYSTEKPASNGPRIIFV
jgi:uncharacterized protein with von Willebrand factor type A (vWA) domain